MTDSQLLASRTAENEALDQSDLGDLLAALEDSDCRRLLQATVDDTLSATELSEQCDLPLSTTYRKVEKLTDAGLLTEQIRLSSSGKHTSEYGCTVETVHFEIGSDGLEASISDSSEQDTEKGSIHHLAGAD